MTLTKKLAGISSIWLLIPFLFLVCFLFWGGPHGTACRILIPQLGIEPAPPAVEAQSLNHWTASEVPYCLSLGWMGPSQFLKPVLETPGNQRN